jgi:hypothetical protein
MKLAVATTTIYVPEVLRLYRTLSDDVAFFVAGDRKTPQEEVRTFVDGLGNAVYLSVEDQEASGYRCSPVIGWNKIMRRNIALLEAMRSGADVIISLDDDNLPLDGGYFQQFARLFEMPFNGLEVRTPSDWFNVGELLDPPVHHRGFPYEHRHVDSALEMSAVANVQIGVAAGLWLGDPDIDAMERLTNRPLVKNLSPVLESGVVVAPGCFSPFNTQNTAVTAELAPLLMVLVGVGRYDDIWASYIAERVMMETPYQVHYGRPLVWQQRNPQSLWRNLRDELLGMEVGARFAADLREAKLKGDSVVEDLRRVYHHARKLDYLPAEVCELGLAWCDDVERVLV